MKVLINLSNLLLREALGRFVSQEIKGCRVLAVDNLDECGDFLPDKVIVDARSARRNPATRWPLAQIILIDTGLEEEEVISLFLHYQLDGVITADANLSLFKKALKAVEKGQVWLDHRRIRAIIDHAEALANPQQDTSLSKREREIVILISQGCKNREIADTLNISEQTVKSHLGRIFRKTNSRSRSQLVPLAMKLKLPVAER